MPISAALGSSALLPAGLGFRNAIINGDFRINQRGLTSGGTTTQLYSGYDRWLWVATGGTVTYSAQSFTPGNAISGYEPKNFARLAISGQSASGDFCLFAQKIEDVRTFAGQQVTLSFWAKAATGTPSIAVELDQSFGAGGSSSVQTYITKIPITTSWVRYIATFSVPSISGKTVGSGTDSYLGLNFWYSAGTALNSRTGSLGVQNNTFDIWGVQLEQNYQPTPFEQRPIGVELQLCQRYFVRIVASEVTNGWLLYTRAADARPTVYYQLPVPPRTTGAQITESGTSYVSDLWSNVSSVSGITQANTSPSSNIVSWYWTTWSSLTTAKMYVWNPNGSNVSISMEL